MESTGAVRSASAGSPSRGHRGRSHEVNCVRSDCISHRSTLRDSYWLDILGEISMTPAQMRELADNLPHDNAGVCDTSAEVLRACADLVESVSSTSGYVCCRHDPEFTGTHCLTCQAYTRIEEISP